MCVIFVLTKITTKLFFSAPVVAEKVVATVGMMPVTVVAVTAVPAVIAAVHLREDLLRLTTEAVVRDGSIVQDRGLTRHVSDNKVNYISFYIMEAVIIWISNGF